MTRKRALRRGALGLLLVCALLFACVGPAHTAEVVTDANATLDVELEQLWSDYGLLGAMRQFSVTRGEGGQPMYEDRPVHGVWDTERAVAYTTTPMLTDPVYLSSRLFPAEDAVYLKTVLDGEHIAGVAPVTRAEFLPHSGYAAQWDAQDGALARLEAYGLTRDDTWQPVYEGQRVLAILDAMAYGRYQLFPGETAIPLGDADGICLRVDYDAPTRPTGLSVMNDCDDVILGVLLEHMLDTGYTEAHAEYLEPYAPFGFADGRMEGQPVHGFFDEARGIFYGLDDLCHFTTPDGPALLGASSTNLIVRRDDTGAITTLDKVDRETFLRTPGVWEWVPYHAGHG